MKKTKTWDAKYTIWKIIDEVKEMETLREISSDYKELIYEALSEEEISEETLEKIKYINGKFEEKIGNMAYIVQELKSKCEIVNKEIDRLTERLVKWHKNMKTLQEYMKNEMLFVGKEKVDTPIYTVRVKKTESVEVDDKFLSEAKEKKLNNLLRIVPERIEPDKKAIKEYINNGHELKHAKITEKKSLNIK